MALLLLILLAGTLLFLFYYELLWKSIEKERGKSLVGFAGDLLFRDKPQAVSASSNSWDDWKYRLRTELYRRDQVRADEVAHTIGATAQDVEKYLDELESEGKVQQAGDAERGIFYKVVSS